MQEELKVFYHIFTTTKDAIEKFMNMLDPVIQNATDEHERLYYHHIYEEEEQRLSRLVVLIPLISKFQQVNDEKDFSPTNNEFNRLLQELNLEKFGLHNFVEHLDLALFRFKDAERSSLLNSLREVSYKDYQQVKQMLIEINSRFDTNYVDPHAHHDEHHDHLDRTTTPTMDTHFAPSKQKKGFTVGSLI
ncbi:IMEF encapsulin system ferritin-like cargo protein [Bacillus sp. OK048]|uniref:IMEF encapsulin system ferritin-like cargo protein n=1 Tax=Bacillus sp. OK048 TaxID=1882761 RepID=UPI000891912F|nr:IMEF encapsulin system ferritin-like cargo protein [Bacillus sp. OK048]SDM73708.1 encapsulated protein [Bacillus sp. OK048]